MISWVYLKSRTNELTDRLNADCERKNRVKDTIYCQIKFTGLKSVLFVILSNLGWIWLSSCALYRWRLYIHGWYPAGAGQNSCGGKVSFSMWSLCVAS